MITAALHCWLPLRRAGEQSLSLPARLFVSRCAQRIHSLTHTPGPHQAFEATPSYAQPVFDAAAASARRDQFFAYFSSDDGTDNHYKEYGEEEDPAPPAPPPDATVRPPLPLLISPNAGFASRCAQKVR